MGKKAKGALKVLQAPVNYANQACLMSRALRARGVDSIQLRYKYAVEGVQYYDNDERVAELSDEDWYGGMLRTVQEIAAEGFDIIHLWNRTLLHRRPGEIVNGMDLPFLRLAGSRLAFRFTGYELRRKSLELTYNRFSPHNYGFNSPYDEDDQKRYLESIAPYIGQFVVQDPEMQSYFPEARIIPRMLDLEKFPLVAAERNIRPVVVHAPSNRQLKGSDFIIKAAEELKNEGLDFDLHLIEDVPHAEALVLYRRADIIIDQLLIGWYGVLAMEAMAMGKTAIAYIRDDLTGYFKNGLPLLNANPETIKAVLRDAIKDRELRGEIGQKARAFVEEVHDSQAVARAAEKMYKKMLKSDNSPMVPNFNYQLSRAAGFTKTLVGLQSFERLHAEIASLKSAPANRMNEKARADALEAEVVALKSALSTGMNERVLRDGLESEIAALKRVLAIQLNGKARSDSPAREIVPVNSGPADQLNEKARADALEAENAALKSALADEVYEKARGGDTSAPELTVLRQEAQRWHAMEAELPLLRQNAERYLALEPLLPELQFKATRCTELQAEVMSLRYKALRYDEVKDKVPAWRTKAESYDRMLARSPVKRLLRAFGIGRRERRQITAGKDRTLSPAKL